MLEDAVVGNKADSIAEQFRQAGIAPFSNIGEQLERHVLVDATRAEPCAVHACTRCTFEEVEAILAQLEHPQVRGHRTDVHDVRTEVEHVVADARQFGKKHAQILPAQWHFEVEQLLDRQHIAIFHAQRRAVIEPVEIGQSLQVRLILDQLFGPAMQQTDMRVHTLDDFAIKFHDKAENAVCSRVLRTEVDRVILDRFIAGCWRKFGLQAHLLAPFSSPGKT